MLDMSDAHHRYRDSRSLNFDSLLDRSLDDKEGDHDAMARYTVGDRRSLRRGHRGELAWLGRRLIRLINDAIIGAAYYGQLRFHAVLFYSAKARYRVQKPAPR